MREPNDPCLFPESLSSNRADRTFYADARKGLGVDKPTYPFKSSGFAPDAMFIDLGTNDQRAITKLGGGGMAQFAAETVVRRRDAACCTTWAASFPGRCQQRIAAARRL